ncbi:hypothetical protein CEP52_002909 [Fusarium oligoseptatum]|uniref:Uncharacterized protein n=1 Tax=Fusarium oligoseptatum TaxID=2604345 RepID=A0A428UBH5_9HYPO|nr:hypothetical protein CEP52_002909 [Fusarium oligoseptatum]
MGFETLSKLAAAGEAAYHNLSKKWENQKARYAKDEQNEKLKEEIRLRNEFLSLVTSKNDRRLSLRNGTSKMRPTQQPQSRIPSNDTHRVRKVCVIRGKLQALGKTRRHEPQQLLAIILAKRQSHIKRFRIWVDITWN